jgi:hypothetical protein
VDSGVSSVPILVTLHRTLFFFFFSLTYYFTFNFNLQNQHPSLAIPYSLHPPHKPQLHHNRLVHFLQKIKSTQPRFLHYPIWLVVSVMRRSLRYIENKMDMVLFHLFFNPCFILFLARKYNIVIIDVVDEWVGDKYQFRRLRTIDRFVPYQRHVVRK